MSVVGGSGQDFNRYVAIVVSENLVLRNFEKDIGDFGMMGKHRRLKQVPVYFVLGALLIASCSGSVSPTHSIPQTGSQLTPVPSPAVLNEAAQRALEDLSNQLNIEPSAVSVLSVESVQWPDSCLGVQATGIMCSMIVTPGYRIVLEAQDQTYEYHTTGNGDHLVGLPEISLTWLSNDDCWQATLNYDQGISYGTCEGNITTASFPAPSQRGDLAKFSLTYHSFQADTTVGRIRFFGTGDQEANPIDERRIAEWGRQLVTEISDTSVAPGFDLVIQWSREGGIAAFCDELTVSIAGEATAYSCKGEQVQVLGRDFIKDEELQQMYAWVDEFHPFEYESRDGATVDIMTIQLNFRGRGDTQPNEMDQQKILDFSSELYFQLSQNIVLERPSSFASEEWISADLQARVSQP
jgi:hypothetical protein